MGCVSTCAGCLLVTLNSIFFLIALVIGGIGGFIKWANVDMFLKQLTESMNSADSGKVNQDDIVKFINTVFDVLRTYGLALFIIGLTLTIITLLAICGVCCQSKCLLITYAFIVFLFLGGMVAVTVLVFIKKDDIKDAGGQEFKKFIDKQYIGPTDSEKLFQGVSGVFDLLQIAVTCCGITNYTDFKDAQKWTNRTFWLHGKKNGVERERVFYNITIPPSCCALKNKKAPEFGDFEGCLTSPNATNSHINFPCYDKVWSYVDSAWSLVRYVFIGITVFVLLLFVAAIFAMRFEKEKIDPI